MNIQEKVLSVIKAHVEKKGLEWVVKQTASNTGNVYMMKDDLDIVCKFFYNFQSDYASIQVAEPNAKVVYGGNENGFYTSHIKYDGTLKEKVNRILLCIDEFIDDFVA